MADPTMTGSSQLLVHTYINICVWRKHKTYITDCFGIRYAVLEIMEGCKSIAIAYKITFSSVFSVRC